MKSGYDNNIIEGSKLLECNSIEEPLQKVKLLNAVRVNWSILGVSYNEAKIQIIVYKRRRVYRKKETSIPEI